MNRLVFPAVLAAVALLAALEPAPVSAGYYGPCYHLPVNPPPPIPLNVPTVPAPLVYSGASYSFYGPSFFSGSYYGPNYIGPNFNTQRYPNPGPYYYTPTGSYTPGYYSYYYTPGYFRY